VRRRRRRSEEKEEKEEEKKATTEAWCFLGLSECGRKGSVKL